MPDRSFGCSESKIKPAGKATLIYDNKTYELPVFAGTEGPNVIDIRKLYDQADIFTYDPGFTSTASCESDITFIDGDKGILLYRGYPIDRAGRAFELPGGLLPAAVRRTAEQGPDGEVRPLHHHAHHGA